MKALMRGVLLSAFVVAASAAHAQFWSGNRLVEHMRDYDKAHNAETSGGFPAFGSGAFLGFVVGTVDVMERATPDEAFALPEGTTIGQLCAIVSKYLKEHPEEWADPACKIVLNAMVKAFPVRTR